MKTTFRKVKPESWTNDTWLAPYCNYIVKLVEYKSGRLIMYLDGGKYDVTGKFTSSNEWSYTIKKVLSKPICNPIR